MMHVLDGFHFADGAARFCPVPKKCPHCKSDLKLLQDLPADRAYFGCWNDECHFLEFKKKRYGCEAASEPDSPALEINPPAPTTLGM